MRVRMPSKRLKACPRGCTQHRTRSHRLAERRTFDGTRCSNCGFVLRAEVTRVRFENAAGLYEEGEGGSVDHDWASEPSGPSPAD